MINLVLGSFVRCLLAIKILAVPIQASQEILFRVLILARRNVQIAATAVNTALQVPCVETAFKAIEVLIRPEPATMIHAACVSSKHMRTWARPTDDESSV
jgi:hypothetical protein